MIRSLVLCAVVTAFLGVIASAPVRVPPAAGDSPAPQTVLLAKTSYADGFVDFWTSRLKRQDGVVLFVLGLGAVALFIITRGKWKK